ncbi:P-loop containing nucleoside triphosphate hydrolase protein [Schizophyllum amplum]|uniref:ATP-dependent RNA helicase n=1 Tax=Schizophyllum amplum TaxID=97359 RepID=A0A550CSH5_9AGAR|nr:P-loop containing nucleoside triphosphate hydrolase protein [Auriculariopsis ampla]
MPPTRGSAPEGQVNRPGRGRGRGYGRGRGGARPPRPAAPQAALQALPVREFSQTAVPFTAHATNMRFKDAPLSDATKAAIKHEFMSPVQAATIQLSLEGHDLVVQAKTGTGKTLAFLLPIIEKLRQQGNALTGDSFSALIVTPTRDLAIQIQNECMPLLHGSPLRVATAIGGTNMNTEANRILRDRCDILVATPGRLNDHLQNNNAGAKFRKLQFLVYDEADRMLDAGFKPQLDQIRARLPDRAVQPRQTLFYSATMDDSVKQIIKATLSSDYKLISTIPENEQNTHMHVPQSVVEVRFEDSLPVALSIILEEIQNLKGAAKIMVFFPTANQTAWAAAALAEISGLPPVWPMHSRLSQSARTRTADAFKNAKTGIMVSSDVTARGMDFPNVSMVLQAGVPGTSQDYVHRLGRTARAGGSGRGVIILDPAEKFFLMQKDIAELPITPSPAPAEGQLQQMRVMLRPAIARVPKGHKGKAYRAWMGFYKQYLSKMRWKPQDLVDRAAVFVHEGLGWENSQLPTLRKQTVGKMGLKGVRGLNIGEVEDE